MSLNLSFKNQVGAFSALSLKQVDAVRRAAILSLFVSIIRATPVDTGRLRANWLTNVGMPGDGVSDSEDPTGAAAMARVSQNLGGVNDVVYFNNNLPYAERIEYDGWSAQAPEGMVRVNVARWQKIVEQAVQAQQRRGGGQ